jgi:drug/metabolite transporter (DMT)-like permease
VVIEKKVPSATEAAALLVLTVGVMMAVFEGSVTGSTAGILLCVCGTVCNAAMICTSGKLLSEKMDVLRLAFYTAPVSCAVLLPLFVVREVSFEFVSLSMHLLCPNALIPTVDEHPHTVSTMRLKEVTSAAVRVNSICEHTCDVPDI